MSAFHQLRGRTFPRSVFLGRVAIFGHENDNGLQDSPRAGCPCREGGDGREEPKNHLHNAWRGRRSRRSEISSSGDVGLWVGTTTLGVVGLAAPVLTLAAFFLGFPAAGLLASVDLGSGFLGLVVFLLAVTLGCLGASVSG